MLDTSRSIRRNLGAAALVIAGLGVAVAVAAQMPLDGAVVASGNLVVEGSAKKIQHPAGGVIGEIRVAEGASVSAGDVLIRLDETLTRANLDIVRNALRAERARLARLQALRDGRKDPQFPADLVADATASDVLEGEARLARHQLTSQEEQKRGLMERIEQARQEVRGLEEERKSYAGQFDIVNADLDLLKPLLERGNIQRPRISALQRELLRHQGSVGDTVAKIAQTHAKIAETQLQIARDEHVFIAGIIKELRETETRIGELQEKRIAAEDQIQRIEIRAPISGMVHQLAVHTVGGVIQPSDVLMLIVPDADRLVVEIRVRPWDIDQLSVGQEARVRFSAFDRRHTDELQGVVSRVAPDLTHDAEARVSYYSAAVRLTERAMVQLSERRLVPGMPAEVFITTEARTLASYLVKPLADQMQRALRER
jgi:HlyD family secretion protein